MAHIRIDNEYTRTPEFLELAKTPALGIWIFLAGQIVRKKGGASGGRRMYYKYLMAEKWLCSSYSVEHIAIHFRKFHKSGKPNMSWVSRHTETLKKLGILKKLQDGKRIVYQLGYINDEGKEILFFDEYFTPKAERAKKHRMEERLDQYNKTMTEHCKEQLQLLQT